jgi:flagellar biosynthesis protein FlhB
VNGGWEKAELVGPIPEEGFLSSIVDTTVEWAAENTIVAILVAILAIAIFVAILVAVLDYCLGADDTTYKNINVQHVQQKPSKKEAKQEAKQADGKPKTE